MSAFDLSRRAEAPETENHYHRHGNGAAEKTTNPAG
jgi:hypothetical protein